MNDADDHDRIRERLIINGVGAVKRYADTTCELFAGRAGKRKVSERLKSRLNRADKARRDVLRRLGRQGRPDLGEIGLGCIGQADRERPANSFLPRSIIRVASKS